VSEEFSPGDLLRMCTTTEAMSTNPELIDWFYGVYIDTVEETHTYDGFTDCTEQYDRVLHNGHVMKIDRYWHTERVS